jgi:hypothetical protein
MLATLAALQHASMWTTSDRVAKTVPASSLRAAVPRPRPTASTRIQHPTSPPEPCGANVMCPTTRPSSSTAYANTVPSPHTAAARARNASGSAISVAADDMNVATCSREVRWIDSSCSMCLCCQRRSAIPSPTISPRTFTACRRRIPICSRLSTERAARLLERRSDALPKGTLSRVLAAADGAPTHRLPVRTSRGSPFAWRRVLHAHGLSLDPRRPGTRAGSPIASSVAPLARAPPSPLHDRPRAAMLTA